MSRPTCGAPTASGGACRRTVGAQGERCAQHAIDVDAADSGGSRPTPAAAVAELARGATFKAAAQAAGMGERTLREHWRTSPTLRAEVTEARAAMLARAVGLLADLVDDAAATLRAVMLDGEAPAGARVSAARAVLTVSADLYDLHELEARISALERGEAAA